MKGVINNMKFSIWELLMWMIFTKGADRKQSRKEHAATSSKKNIRLAPLVLLMIVCSVLTTIGTMDNNKLLVDLGNFVFCILAVLATVAVVRGLKNGK